MNILAIDPGKGGGIAVFYTAGTDARKMPGTLKELADTARALAAGPMPSVCYLEAVPKFCGHNRPAASIFTLAESYGAAQGVLASVGIRTVLVRPQEWQKGLNLGKRKDCKNDHAWKAKLKAEAQRRFPALTVTLATADALLLLDYALRQERAQIFAATKPNN
jgi:hypothetical protein